MRGALARIGAASVCLFSEAGLAPFPRFGSFRRLCAAITANPPRPRASLPALPDFYFQPTRRAPAAIGRSEAFRHNALATEPASLAKYNRTVLLVMLVEYDAQI